MNLELQPFSIVMCTCNGARFLDEQLRTLRVQAGVAEIIVVDDASTDGTPALLAAHAAVDERVRVHQNPQRLGVTANFERGIALATAPWIVLADQDDIWRPDKLVRMARAWDGESGLLHHASWKFRGELDTDDVPLVAHDRRKFRGSDWRRLLYRNSIVGHTLVVRRELVQKLMPFPAGLPHDWWIGVGAARRGHVQYVDEHLVYYRIHGKNAYHAAGSRWRRLREEHALRVGMLRAMLAEVTWSPEERGFAEQYLALLEGAAAVVLPVKLARFYLRHAPVFFSGAKSMGRNFDGVRRSAMAALAAKLQWSRSANGAVPASVFR